MSNSRNDVKPLTGGGFPQPLVKTQKFGAWCLSILMPDPNFCIQKRDEKNQIADHTICENKGSTHDVFLRSSLAG
jgi:hypothetical protein